MSRSDSILLQSEVKIASILSFCSNDYRFFDRCLEGLRPFSSQIIVTVCDHFFDGTPENYALIEALYAKYPDVTFIEFAYRSETSYCYSSLLSCEHLLWRHLWHNTGRWIAYFFLDPSIEYLYFSDGDEITEGDRFASWLSSREFESYKAIRFACYWYFREARYRALVEDDMTLLVKRSEIDPFWFWSEHERMGLYLDMPAPKRIHMKDHEGRPFVHHYSWVRARKEMEKKFASWGHFWERDWPILIQEEYGRPFNGTDFIRKYRYEEVTPFFDPMAVPILDLPSISYEEHRQRLAKWPHVIAVTPESMFRKELKYMSLSH